MTGKRAEAGDAAARLRRWLTASALPLWASTGFDASAFHERLRLDGTPDAGTERRLFVQARQIYVYAHAATLGWYDGRAQARAACAWAVRHARADGSPGFAHRLHPDGRIADATRDTYDHAFVLLALAHLVHAGEDVRALIDETLAFIDAHLTLGDGSLAEGMPSRLPRRQNPHMHMLEAMLALHETIGYPSALARAGRLVALMQQRFLDSETRTLGEYFTDAWAPAPGVEGIEPGHQAEWAWLLRKYERLSGAPPGALARDLLDGALRAATSAGLVDEVDRAHVVRRASRRVWPQAELAKAWIAEAEIGAAGAAERAHAALGALMRGYLDQPFEGGWIDQFGADGAALSTFVPASTLYHVFVAAAEGERVLGS
jgi:mannose/cellobiose epimerase-like protein (N-acyl-D-glucosamine 2-epimerase family)